MNARIFGIGAAASLFGIFAASAYKIFTKKLRFEERLNSIHYPLDLAHSSYPEFFCAINYTIMDDPMNLGCGNNQTGNLIDCSAYNKLQTNPTNNKRKDPFTRQDIEAAFADMELKEKIEEFVSTREAIAKTFMEDGIPKSEWGNKFTEMDNIQNEPENQPRL